MSDIIDFWVCVGLAPMRDDAGKKVRDLPYGTRVGLNGLMRDLHSKTVQGNEFLEVFYSIDSKSYDKGWVYAGFLEDYQEEFPQGLVKIDIGTPFIHDAAQYAVWRERVQYNLCGELCVLYCTGWDLDIGEYLDKLAADSRFKAFFLRVFPNWRSRGTTPYDLDLMLDLYDGYALPSRTLESALMDPILKRAIVSPGRYAHILQSHQIISSCHIDVQTGKLRGQGVLHWVVLEKVTPDEAGRGWVELYNPFNNKLERYSWDEFIKSAGQPYGILVERAE